MPDLAKVNEALNFYVRPQTFPLAVKMCQSNEELPERARIPKRDLGYFNNSVSRDRYGTAVRVDYSYW
jgi:uncharacterized protein (DUF169 family)